MNSVVGVVERIWVKIIKKKIIGHKHDDCKKKTAVV